MEDFDGMQFGYLVILDLLFMVEKLTLVAVPMILLVIGAVRIACHRREHWIHRGECSTRRLRKKIRLPLFAIRNEQRKDRAANMARGFRDYCD
jgi:hypothetical protein